MISAQVPLPPLSLYCQRASLGISFSCLAFWAACQPGSLQTCICLYTNYSSWIRSRSFSITLLTVWFDLPSLLHFPFSKLVCPLLPWLRSTATAVPLASLLLGPCSGNYTQVNILTGTHFAYSFLLMLTSIFFALLRVLIHQLWHFLSLSPSKNIHLVPHSQILPIHILFSAQLLLDSLPI